ncbi:MULTISPECIES: ABC transporter permease [unclassified Mycolicibacterium]|uniref:ABC transporter permease n=1 Tax=unclassified Mycolicibacterium TaxID=2636767 RepID=UPI0012DDBEF0|nr:MULTISPECIES: ABC transporter permease [unclassified Mycolicibacterium]MUL80679.1 ABC transporter permease [Mycolicibacterium sp. CBMA 329]MUL86446.1 ABC transporter permease [Mycolicibacterium sp. CBMA 331]MUM01308.1 ABC transporter permease [Mycolicibacterium sp. CBMA 334]MUM29044.1 ABC transporter permease [Mycolicibacterium sp. CBMA 295]MUM36742.1 ABC transporter permease [Mycolicibacterium sp. CBMA 247]
MNFWIDALTVGIVLGTPLLLASLGELIAERSGVMNLGVEGMMLVGGVTGFAFAVQGVGFPMAFGLAAAAGGLLALLHAVMTVSLGVNQVVMGLTLTVLGTGLSSYVGTSLGDQPLADRLDPVPVPLLSDIPIVGEILFRHDPIVYLTVAAVIAASLAISRTRIGLWLRAAGEAPAAADAAGVPLFAIRYGAVVIGGALAGIAGGYLSMVYVGSWSNQMTAGRGWIALALVIFATWRPLLLIPGALLFGFIDALNFQLQVTGVSIPSPYLSMMPYIFTLVALTVAWTRQRKRQWGMPTSLGEPYEREARA